MLELIEIQWAFFFGNEIWEEKQQQQQQQFSNFYAK